MDYEPEYGDFVDDDYEDYEGFDFDDCPFGSGGYPQLGVEECEFTCTLSKSCMSIYDDRKDCVNPLRIDEKGCASVYIECVFFHMGKCYIDFSNYSPSGLRAIFWRLRCRLGIIPPVNKRIAAHYQEK